MKLVKFLFIGITLIQLQGCTAQTEDYEVVSVAFYNLENLFDTINDSLVNDKDRTPEGSYRWDEKKYNTKIQRIGEALSEISASENLPDILGVCELENLGVMKDLVHSKIFRKNVTASCTTILPTIEASM